jgi:enamine deaminase RidA (YjgF/YER057c/UK114 family)
MDGYTLFALNAGSDQLHLTVRIDRHNGAATAAAANILEEAASVLHSRGMRILNERVFGALDFYEDFTRIRERFGGMGRGPFSYIGGAPVHGRGLSGVQIHAVRPGSDENPRILHDGERPCGSVWKRTDATYIQMTGIHGAGEGVRCREDQASAMFEAVSRVLASESAGFRNVLRTWIYLADILEWYERFNAVRTDRFQSSGLLPGSATENGLDALYLPASTGIGGRNPSGSFCCCDVLAVTGNVEVSVLPGMLQPSAASYGSAFSRGICMEENDCRQIFVSGTAAIDAAGRSLYPGDAAAQIRRTLEVVESVLGEKGAKFEDIRSATVYLKRAEDRSVYEELARRPGLENLPAVCVVADICRDELLFEMDALAVIDKGKNLI